MAIKKPAAKALAILIIAVVIASGLGLGAVLSSQQTEALRDSRAAVSEQVLPYNWMMGASSAPDPARAELNRLDSEIWASEQATDRWVNALGIYVLVVLSVTALFATMVFLRDVIALAERKIAERKAAAEPLSTKIARVADAIDRARAPKVSLDGGRHSTADELRKWTALRDEGLVSEEEFAKMRSQLLK